MHQTSVAPRLADQMMADKQSCMPVFAVDMELSVNATDAGRGILHIRENIRVARAGRVTLLYPEWLPGYHAPEAPLQCVADLHVREGGRELAWRRDAVHMHAFHVELPDKADRLEITFQLLTPTASEQGRVGITPRQLNLEWNSVLLYPAGYGSKEIGVSADIILTDRWQLACALTPCEQE